MKVSTRYFVVALTAITIIALTGFFLNIEFPYRIKGPCYFSSCTEWSIVQPQPEILLSKVSYNNPKKVQSFNLLQFERPDFVTFTLDPSIEVGLVVSKDAIVGTIQSAENKLRFEELSGELNIAMANLAFLKTGEKPAVQEEKLQAMQYAKTELAAYQPGWKRKQELFRQNLISLEEYELAETKMKLLEQQVSITGAELQTVRTGEKAEKIRIAERQITDIENRLATIDHKLSSLTIFSPIEGVMMGKTDETSVMTIAKLDTMVVEIPVDESKIKYLRTNAPLTIMVDALEQSRMEATILSIDKTPQFVGGRSMYIARANLPNRENQILPGMTGFVQIACKPVTIMGLLKRWMKKFSRHSCI